MTPMTTMATESNGSCSTAEAPLDAEVELVDGAAEEDVGSVEELELLEELVLEEDTLEHVAFSKASAAVRSAEEQFFRQVLKSLWNVVLVQIQLVSFRDVQMPTARVVLMQLWPH